MHRFLESVISDRRPQFIVESTKKLNSMLEIEMRLSTAFYLQIDGQIEYMNWKLKKYLQFFVDYRQKGWLASAEFVVNSKVHSVTKVSLFIANYRRELRMGVDIKKKEKMKNITEFSEKIKRI